MIRHRTFSDNVVNRMNVYIEIFHPVNRLWLIKPAPSKLMTFQVHSYTDWTLIISGIKVFTCSSFLCPDSPSFLLLLPDTHLLLWLQNNAKCVLLNSPSFPLLISDVCRSNMSKYTSETDMLVKLVVCYETNQNTFSYDLFVACQLPSKCSFW